MSNLVRTGKVAIREIRDAANNSFTVLVEQSYKVEGANSVVGFFMEGHPGIGARKPLVARLGVSAQQMEKFNFEVGQDISAVIGTDINIQVTESFEPKNIGVMDDGTPKMQTAKTAGKDGAFLTKDGKKIYRTAEVVFGDAHDDLIQHDVVAKGNVIATPAKREVASLVD